MEQILMFQPIAMTGQRINVQQLMDVNGKSIKNSKILEKLSKKIVKSLNIYYKNSHVEAGSGSLPTEKIPSVVICLQSNNISANKIYKKFLHLDTPLIGYIKNDIFHIDLKAIPNDQIDLVIKSINKIV